MAEVSRFVITNPPDWVSSPKPGYGSNDQAGAPSLVSLAIACDTFTNAFAPAGRSQRQH
jgi:hypothetical protein